MVTARSLTKKFGKIVALQEVDFTVEPGEFVFLTGASGSGKAYFGGIDSRWSQDQPVAVPGFGPLPASFGTGISGFQAVARAQRMGKCRPAFGSQAG